MENSSVAPFVKWAGGKRQVVSTNQRKNARKIQ